MYNDIEELKDEIEAFRRNIADSRELIENLRRNENEMKKLKEELEEYKAQAKKSQAEQQRLTEELAGRLNMHRETILKEAHPRRKNWR